MHLMHIMFTVVVNERTKLGNLKCFGEIMICYMKYQRNTHTTCTEILPCVYFRFIVKGKNIASELTVCVKHVI